MRTEWILEFVYGSSHGNCQFERDFHSSEPMRTLSSSLFAKQAAAAFGLAHSSAALSASPFLHALILL